MGYAHFMTNATNDGGNCLIIALAIPVIGWPGAIGSGAQFTRMEVTEND
jgi:hypothetical protein